MYQELDNDILIRANELAQEGKVEAALLNYDEVLNHKDQYYSQAVIHKVQLLEMMGSFETALATVEAALQHEKYYKYFELKGDLQKKAFDKTLEAEANYRQALVMLKQLLAQTPTNVFLHIEKGNLLRKLNQFQEAIDALIHAEQLTTSVEELGSVHYSKGECYEAWAQLIDDITYYEKALDSFEKAKRHGKNATYYIDALTTFIRQHKALQQIEKKIVEHPEIAHNYFEKAQILWDMPDGLKQYHEIVHLLDMAEGLSKSNKEKGLISYTKYVYYKKKKERDAGASFFDDKDTLQKKTDLLKKVLHYYKLCSKKDGVAYDVAYISKLLATYYANLGEETSNLYFYKLALDHFLFAREHALDPYYANIFKDSEAGVRDMKEKLEGSEYSEDDKEKRTVEGIIYQSLEDADDARNEIATVEKIRSTIDLSNYDSLLRALDSVTQLSVETKTGKKLLKEIRSKIEELDRKRSSRPAPYAQLQVAEDDDLEELAISAQSEDEQAYDDYEAEEEDNDEPLYEPDFDAEIYDDYGPIEDVEESAYNPNTNGPTIFDDLFDAPQRPTYSNGYTSDDDDEYERFVFDENDPLIQEDLLAIAQVLRGDEYKHNESIAIRCLNQLYVMSFNTPIGAQFIHILERIIADFDVKARTVNGIIYASRAEAQELIESMLDGHECQSETEQLEVLRFHNVVEKAKRSGQKNIPLLNLIIPELVKGKYNRELLKPYLISLLDDSGRRELLSKLYQHQERTEMRLFTQISVWALAFTLSVVLIMTLSFVGMAIVAFAYPFYLYVQRGQEYMWKFFTNNGTVPISRYEEYFARPLLRFQKSD